MNVRAKVEQILTEIPQARENDNLLIAYFIKDEFKLQNTFDIALQFKTNVYESIRRARQKVQETNPLLRPSKEVYEARLKKEAEIREVMRGV
jgi:hypothetical protein